MSYTPITKWALPPVVVLLWQRSAKPAKPRSIVRYSFWPQFYIRFHFKLFFVPSLFSSPSLHTEWCEARLLLSDWWPGWSHTIAVLQLMGQLWVQSAAAQRDDFSMRCQLMNHLMCWTVFLLHSGYCWWSCIVRTNRYVVFAYFLVCMALAFETKIEESLLSRTIRGLL